MKKFICLVFFSAALLSCGKQVRIVVDAEGNGSFDFKPSKEVSISGAVNGSIDSLTAEFTVGKKAEIREIEKWIEGAGETRLLQGATGSLNGLVRVYIDGVQIAHIPFTESEKQTCKPDLSLRGALGDPPTYRNIAQIQSWGMTGIGFAYSVGIAYRTSNGQQIETTLDSGGCLWHTTATDIPADIPDGTAFTIWVDPHGCIDGKAYSPEVLQVNHSVRTQAYVNVWGNCFTGARIGEVQIQNPK